MDNLTISKALLNLVPGALWTLRGDDYANLEWESEGNPPTLAEIESEISKLTTKEKAEADKAEADKAALLAKLGITADEAKLLLS
jgi:hypothetical protein